MWVLVPGEAPTATCRALANVSCLDQPRGSKGTHRHRGVPQTPALTFRTPLSQRSIRIRGGCSGDSGRTEASPPKPRRPGQILVMLPWGRRWTPGSSGDAGVPA